MENDVLERSQTNEIMVCVSDSDGIREEEVVVNLSSLVVVEVNQTQEKQNFQLQPIVIR